MPLKTSLLPAVVLVLASVSVASAECAWVLWAGAIRVSLPGGLPVGRGAVAKAAYWGMRDFSESKADCEKRFDEQFRELERVAKLFMSPAEQTKRVLVGRFGGGGRLMKADEDGKAADFTWLQCLPNGADPTKLEG